MRLLAVEQGCNGPLTAIRTILGNLPVGNRVQPTRTPQQQLWACRGFRGHIPPSDPSAGLFVRLNRQRVTQTEHDRLGEGNRSGYPGRGDPPWKSWQIPGWAAPSFPPIPAHLPSKKLGPLQTPVLTRLLGGQPACSELGVAQARCGDQLTDDLDPIPSWSVSLFLAEKPQKLLD